jgi:8-oxo-dGTP diphosphatase
MTEEISNIYGNRVRVRVCGLCWRDGELLLVNHHSITEADFWAPPGGGVEFGALLEETLEREFKEETGLDIRTGPFLFGCQFLAASLHAVELFFDVEVIGGTLLTGTDPELPIIKEVRFISPSEFDRIPQANLHGIFKTAKKPDEFKKLGGFYRI